MGSKIKYFYEIALSEGEGFGTAYEYLVKHRLLKKVSGRSQKNNLLIAGLPEKYGCSFDFLFFAEKNNWDCEIVDERKEKVNQMKEFFRTNCMSHKNKVTIRLYDLCNLPNIYVTKSFDLAFSCEVLQRFSYDEQVQYIKSLKKIAKKIILFVPNGDNKKHHFYSGLGTISKKKLISMFGTSGKTKYFSAGYIDIPPWPPGIRRNSFGEKMGRNRQNILLTVLKVVSLAEPIYPFFFKAKCAHLIYIIS